GCAYTRLLPGTLDPRPTALSWLIYLGRLAPYRPLRHDQQAWLRRTSSSARQGRTWSVRHTRIIITHYGGPDALRVVEEECPEPMRGEVRVRVLAAGVSLPDIMMREGVHPETPPLPFTPGWDLVGVVDRRGDGVSGVEPGQIVAALPITGAYAE